MVVAVLLVRRHYFGRLLLQVVVVNDVVAGIVYFLCDGWLRGGVKQLLNKVRPILDRRIMQSLPLYTEVILRPLGTTFNLHNFLPKRACSKLIFCALQTSQGSLSLAKNDLV